MGSSGDSTTLILLLALRKAGEFAFYVVDKNDGQLLRSRTKLTKDEIIAYVKTAVVEKLEREFDDAQIVIDVRLSG